MGCNAHLFKMLCCELNISITSLPPFLKSQQYTENVSVTLLPFTTHFRLVVRHLVLELFYKNCNLILLFICLDCYFLILKEYFYRLLNGHPPFFEPVNHTHQNVRGTFRFFSPNAHKFFTTYFNNEP